MDLYTENILDHYRNPRNEGALPDATLSAEDINPLCGDKVRIDLRLENNRVADVGFIGEGCAISKATASMLTELLPGKTPQELYTLENEDIYELIGVPLSPPRVKCALLSLVVLKKAILLGRFPELKSLQS